mmetsp:Transcript_78141/g.253583  ORF Transcript_78141/g.253583 Transcript_78141/m.253583 type:complete len:278 (-) Transcript_78141:2682-3515(-)
MKIWTQSSSNFKARLLPPPPSSALAMAAASSGAPGPPATDPGVGQWYRASASATFQRKPTAVSELFTPRAPKRAKAPMEAVMRGTESGGAYSMKSCTRSSSNWNTVGNTSEASRAFAVEPTWCIGGSEPSATMSEASRRFAAEAIMGSNSFGRANWKPTRSSSTRAAMATRWIIVPQAAGCNSWPEAWRMPSNPSQTRARASSWGTRNSTSRCRRSSSCAASGCSAMASAPFFSACAKMRHSAAAAAPRSSPRSSAMQTSVTIRRTRSHMTSSRLRL